MGLSDKMRATRYSSMVSFTAMATMIMAMLAVMFSSAAAADARHNRRNMAARRAAAALQAMQEEIVSPAERDESLRFVEQRGLLAASDAAAKAEVSNEMAKENSKSCPRWGHISQPEGLPPTPRRAGFAFSLASHDGTAMFVVGGGERRGEDGPATVLKKVRVLKLAQENGEGRKEWVNPAPERGAKAEHVWRKFAATAFFPYPSGQRGDLFEMGGVYEAEVGPVADAVVLRVNANADESKKEKGFKWHAVLPKGDMNSGSADIMALEKGPNGKLESPGKLQSATLTHVGSADKAVLFGGDDGTSVQGDTWTLQRTGGGTPESMPSWSWTKHAVAVGEEAPTPRTGHAAVAFPESRGAGGENPVVMVFGGKAQGGGPVDDGENTYIFSVETARWRAVPRKSGIDGPSPSPRTGASLTYVAAERAVYLFGGCQPWEGNTCFQDLWRYDIETYEWKEIDISKKQDPSYVLPDPVGDVSCDFFKFHV